MRFFRVVMMTLFLIAPARAGEAALDETVWAGLAGMAEELEGEQLELRDELIAAHIAYLAALEAALAEIGGMADGDARLPLAWGRAEYLLETSHRLLAETGEHEAFLKATRTLRPDAAPAGREAALESTADEDDPAGGLTFEDGQGRPLRLVRDGEAIRLLAESGDDAPVAGEFTARPRDEIAAVAAPFIPMIKARAAWLRALTLERLGRVGEAAAETSALGMIRDWLVLGPIEGDTEANSYVNFSLADVYESLAVSRYFNGKNGPIQWRPASSVDPLGRLFPGALIRAAGRNTAFALALVHSGENAPAVMRFGSDVSAAVCVNHFQGRRVREGRFPDFEEEAFNVWLRRGWNVILVRTSSRSDRWTLAARLTRPDGTAFPGYVARPDKANAPAILRLAGEAAKRTARDVHYRPGQPAELGGLSILSRRLEAAPTDARANFYLASLLSVRHMFDGDEQFDRELIFRRALEFSDGAPFFTLMAARLVDAGLEGPDREENLRLVLLRSVADQGSAAALVDIGRLYLDVMRQPRRADEYAERALEMNPLSLRGGVLDYDVAVAMGWEPVAHNLLGNLVKRHPSAASARLRLGRTALAAGRPRQALSEYHAVLNGDAGNAEALDGVVAALGLLGQTSAAVDLLVAHVERFPYDFRCRLTLAALYRTLGRDDDARAVLDAALAMAPDDAPALAMRGGIDREMYAVGGTLGEPGAVKRRPRQELDMSPPVRQPPNGWEYLYFQIEDRIENDGSINRTVSFALRIYSESAARMLRHLGFWLERDFESGAISSLGIIQPNGRRESYTPPASAREGDEALKFYLPPLQVGMAVEAEVEIRRRRIPFLGDYFGQIAPMTQQAPVRLSRYMFTAPRERRLFFQPINGAPEAMVVESTDGAEVTRIWEMNDLPAFAPEPDSPGQHSLMPCIQVSSFEDWDEFARWYWRLIGVQYHTPPELRMLAENLGRGETVPMVKLDKAAEWVARNIGHRDWEYGPYAFRPINARSILSRLSADGKDRTLFLCLLAREYGLTAWPVLARLRDRRFAPSGNDRLGLPLLDHFNHSLVMVESSPGGDVFLDASNPYRSPGVMPSQLFGSPGVAISPSAAERVLIPDGGAAACQWEETASLVVDEDGSVLWEEEVKGQGTAAETLRSRFRNEETRAEAWTAFLASLGAVPSATWEHFREIVAEPSSALFGGRARLREIAAVDDRRVVLAVPGLPATAGPSGGDYAYPLSLREFADKGTRQYDLVLPHGFRIARRLTVSYPEEWRLVNAPRPFEQTYPFGSVSLAAVATPGGLELEFSAELPGHVVAAGDYPGFREMAALAERWMRPLLVWEKH